YTQLNEQEAKTKAKNIWASINGINLVQNILPTKERAQLILQKGKDHNVETVYLRK
ncbi:type I pantothenate kinase, partial [Vibrio alfacsensis]